MSSAGYSMSRPRDNSCRNDGAHHTTGEVIQDHRAPGAPFCARNQGPGTVPKDRLAALAPRATERPLTGRFAGPWHIRPGPKRRSYGKDGEVQKPAGHGVPANPAWQAATQPMRWDLLNVQIVAPPGSQDGG